jgi:tripartite-type tricarboxylate transporter receptor subunit TctC
LEAEAVYETNEMISSPGARHVARTALLFFASTMLAWGGESFPTRPIRVVNPFPPGGGSDTLARAIAPALSDELGKAVVVDNRPGAGGLVGNQIVAQARPDGYTLLLQGLPFVVAPQLSKATGYDPLRDFTAVAMVAVTPIVLVVHPSVPAASLKEFVAHAKAHSGKLNMASGGTGATSHLAAEVFKLSTGAPFTHVPYKGMGPALVDVLSGQVHSIFATLPSALSYVQSGRVKALAVTSSGRSQLAPDIPTAEESGYKGLVVVNWYGYLAPRGTPSNVVSRLNSAMAKVVEAQPIRTLLLAGGLEGVTVTSPDVFAKHLRLEVERWGRVIKQSGMRVE